MNYSSVYATTAMFPNVLWEESLANIRAGTTVRGNPVRMDVVQLCPQTPSIGTQEQLDSLRSLYPNTRFRFHANIRVTTRPRKIWSLSTREEDAIAYYKTLAPLCAGMDFISLHAGDKVGNTSEMYDFLRRVQDILGCPVGVEGMYPTGKHYEMATWAEYKTLLDVPDILYALDLSHLNIVAHRFRRMDIKLVEDLLANPRCREIHISDNNGTSDQHCFLREQQIWWEEIFTRVSNSQALVFTEERNSDALHPNAQLLAV